jgi:hypothetical protein
MRIRPAPFNNLRTLPGVLLLLLTGVGVLAIVFVVLLFINSKPPLAEQELIIDVKSPEFIANQDGEEVITGEERYWIGTGGDFESSYLGIGFPADSVRGKRVTFARLRIVTEEDQWIGTEFDIFTEIAEASRPFTEQKISERPLSDLKLSYSGDARWDPLQAYFFDVTGPVRELFEKYPDAEIITLIARSSAEGPYGRKYIPAENFDLIVNYLE